MIEVSAIPTPDELRSLAVLIPTYFRLGVEDGRVALTLCTPGRSPAVPLVTYEIVPGAQRDYAGPRLGELVAEIAAQAVLSYRALRDSPAAPLARILQIANDPPLLATRSKASDGALVARTKTVHSATATDWFPDAGA
jgi:hypothetical protein